MTWTRGAGSLRQRRPGVWEVRVALGPDLVSGRSAVRSVTVHGDWQGADYARQSWAARAALVRSGRRAQPGVTVAELLRMWNSAEHAWRPSTVAGFRSTVGYLVQDKLASRRAVEVSPSVLRAGWAAWSTAGWADPTIWARVRVLRSALGWAHAECVLDQNPLEGMRGPPQPDIRQHAPVEAVRAAADSGARRGELAALQFTDLDGDVLTIARGTSNEIVGPPSRSRLPPRAGRRRRHGRLRRLWSSQRWPGRRLATDTAPRRSSGASGRSSDYDGPATDLRHRLVRCPTGASAGMHPTRERPSMRSS